jgi:DNA end-binding protein Ku
MARPVWTGAISFGLVNVPVRAMSAVRDHDVHFHQLDKKSGARVRNKHVSEKTGREVKNDDIEMGFELNDGNYVTFDKDELNDLRPASTRSIEVTDFVALDEIDPIYYERTYWLVPTDSAATKPYHLLLAAMQERERAAIGTVVMRNKQYLAAIRPMENALAMSTMRFADEVVPKSDIDGIPSKSSAKPDAKTLRMATQLIDALAADWKPEQYHDTYAEELKARIKAKGAGKRIVDEEPAEEPGAKVLDLMEALRNSVKAAKHPTKHPAKRSPAAKKKPTKKAATSKATAKKPAKKATRKSA